ncbi:MAG: hypothetical protein LAT68_08175 [Cyclobacteriaceae bacterium]|nr:hypothetical protein [Cyclobacteriaceae bacterium]MCH8516291.1 hypothetical protein [Cyclobacteriaceae bacterium]
MKKFLICLSFLGLISFSSFLSAGPICEYLGVRFSENIKSGDFDAAMDTFDDIIFLNCPSSGL